MCSRKLLHHHVQVAIERTQGGVRLVRIHGRYGCLGRLLLLLVALDSPGALLR
jgi:hypothetical protein